MFKLETKTGQLLTLFLLSIVWGSSFILMKRGLVSFTAYQVGAFRMFFAALFFAPLLLKHYRKVTRKNVFWLMYVGIVGNFVPAILFTTAEVHISSSLAGMLNSLTPFFALMVGYLAFQTSVRWWNVLGVLTGLIGAVGLVAQGAKAIFDGDIRYAGLVLLASFLYGTSINITKTKLPGLSPLVVAALALGFTWPVATAFLLWSDLSASFALPSWPVSLGFVLILAVLGTSLALIVFNTLIQKTSALFASSVTYIVPIFAMMWGVFDGEIITFWQYFFMGVILLGVYLVNRTRTPVRQ